MNKQTTNKKPSALARAKAKIQLLEEQLNVSLDDNVVTQKELKTLRVYKYISIGVAIGAFIGIVSLIASLLA